MISKYLLEASNDYQNECSILKNIKNDYIAKILDLEKEIDESFKNYNKIYDIYFYRSKIAKIDKYISLYTLCLEALEYMIDFNNCCEESIDCQLDKVKILKINNAVSTNIFDKTILNYVNKINEFYEDIIGFNIQYNFEGEYKKKHLLIESKIFDEMNVDGLKLCSENNQKYVGDGIVRSVIIIEGKNKYKAKHR